MSLGGSSIAGGVTGGTTTTTTTTGANVLDLAFDSDMMDYTGETWSDIGLTLEAFLDILPTAQDAVDNTPANGLWESIEGRVGLV